MRYYHKSSWRHPDNLAKRKTWGEASIRTLEDGTVVHYQRKYVGYGFGYYIIVGTFDGISKVVESILRNYPPAGYGTIIEWPPDAEKYKHLINPDYINKGWSQTEIYAPYEQLSENLWVLWCDHSESCE